MIFTSGTQARDGRTVNHDPEPFYIVGTDVRVKSPAVAYGYVTAWSPRPKFAVLDNPILAGFRDDPRLSTPDRASDYLLYLVQDRGHIRRLFSDEKIDHATRVLNKLAALK